MALAAASLASVSLDDKYALEKGRVYLTGTQALVRLAIMQRQPGFISISLHRSLDGKRIVNYVQWRSRDLLHQAHQSPEFRKEWSRFDDMTGEIDPHLYEVAKVVEATG